MLNLKPFRQQSGLCGPATLKMVLFYYGITKTEKELAELTNCKPEYGIEAEEFKKVASLYNLNCVVKDDADIDDLRYYVDQQKIPVIVQWFHEDDGHYSAVVEIDQENIYLQDPELGMIRALKLSTFKNNWFDFLGEFPNKKEDFILRRLIAIFPQEMQK